MGYKPAVVDDIVGSMTYGLRMIMRQSEHKFIQTLREMRMGRYSVINFCSNV